MDCRHKSPFPIYKQTEACSLKPAALSEGGDSPVIIRFFAVGQVALDLGQHNPALTSPWLSFIFPRFRTTPQFVKAGRRKEK
jgi:hypothetical protein